MKESDIQTGKRLAHCLRHAPEVYGVTLSEDGSASFASVSAAMGVSEAELMEVVEQDDKGRFVVSEGRIWAAQGHSVKTVAVPMEKFESSEALFHGTKKDTLETILKEGLLPRSRTHVHLSRTVDVAESVASRRKGESVILEVDTQSMLAEGHTLLVSSNGVVLADAVPAKFLSVV